MNPRPAATAILIVTAITLLVVLSILFPHAVGFVLGVWPSPGDGVPWTYQLWSGFVPSAIIIAYIVRTIDDAFCAEEWCFRKPVAKGPDHLRYCKRHLPEHR